MLFTLFVFASALSFSQKWVDLGNVFWRFSPFNSADNSTEQYHFNSITANVKIPLVLSDENLLIIGLEHQYNSISAAKISSNFDKIEFSSSMLQFGWEHKWNKKSKMLFMTLGRLNSDYQSISSSHFQLGGLVLGTTKKSEKFQWKYGIYYNAEFFGPMFVPLFGFNWEINDQWRLKTVIPMNMEVSYFPNERFRTGLFFEGINASYRMGNPDDMNTHYMDKADNNLSLFAEFNLGKNVWFHLKAGYSILREYNYYDNKEKLGMKMGPVNIANDRSEIAPIFNDGWSIETRMIYRLPLKD
ncbi:MAG: hypothetical protein COA33_003315 [Fluviicola sp.]|nr:hypothetical protein [Fluviicola sp.]